MRISNDVVGQLRHPLRSCSVYRCWDSNRKTRRQLNWNGRPASILHFEQKQRALSGTNALDTNVKELALEDSLAAIENLDKESLNVESSKSVPALVTAVLQESIKAIGEDFVTKADLTQMHHEIALPKVREELNNKQDLHVASLRRNLQDLQNELQKVRSNLRYDADKVTAGQRLDLNLEQGHIREVLTRQKEERDVVSEKLSHDVADLRQRLHTNKVYVINCCIGVLVTVTTLALGVARFAL